MSAPDRRTLLKGAVLMPLAHVAPGAATAPAIFVATSPDGLVRVLIDPAGPTWSMVAAGRTKVESSPLALVLADGGRLGPGATFRGVTRRRIAGGGWTPPYGIRTRYADDCEEIAVELEDVARGSRFAIVARAYDIGGAVRFRLISAPASELELSGEETQIRLPADAILHASRDEGEYQRTVQTRVAPAPHPDLTGSSDAGALADTPVTAMLADGSALLVTESDRLHYPRAMLRSTDMGLVTYLMRYPGRATGPSRPGDTEPEQQFAVPARFETPWRVVISAPSAAALMERQDLIATLASPNRLRNTRWIRPGRAIRIRKYDTAGAIEAIDFAVARKLEYVEYDWH